jgi:hypothetical protein
MATASDHLSSRRQPAMSTAGRIVHLMIAFAVHDTPAMVPWFDWSQQVIVSHLARFHQMNKE